jgi:hypothetical protein
MKLSDETIGVLKNFSTINHGVVFKPGNTIRTISPQKTIMASAVVKETFEVEVGIYDISRLLSTFSLFEDSQIHFDSDRIILRDGRRKLDYTYASVETIVSPEDKEIIVPSPEATFDVTWSDVESVIRASGMMNLPEIAFISDGTNVIFTAMNTKNPTADSYSVILEPEDEVEEFCMVIKAENLKLMARDYKVALSSKGIAHFKSDDIEYWIALDAK